MPACAHDLNLSVVDALVNEYVQDVNLRCSAETGGADLLSAAHQIRTTLLSGDTQAVLDQQNDSAKALSDSLIFRECRGSLLLARQHLIELLRAGKDMEALAYLQQHITPLSQGPNSSIAEEDVKQMAEMMLYDGSTTPPIHFWPTRSVVANRMAAYLRLESGSNVPKLLLIIICMALMDGRMFGWRLPETQKDSGGSEQSETEEIRPLHCVVHPILRVRLPTASSTNETQSEAPATGDGGSGQQDAAAAVADDIAGGEGRPQNRSTSALSEFAGVLVPDAEAALASSRGDMGPALQQQLLRVPVREEVLLDMVQEYCELRGLPKPPESATADTDTATDRAGLLGLGVYDRADETPASPSMMHGTARGPSTPQPPQAAARRTRRLMDVIHDPSVEDLLAHPPEVPIRSGEGAMSQQAVANSLRLARRNLQSNMQTALEAMGLLEDAAPVVTNTDAAGAGPSAQGTRSDTAGRTVAGDSSTPASLNERRYAWLSDTVGAATGEAAAAAIIGARQGARRPESLGPQAGAVPEAGGSRDAAQQAGTASESEPAQPTQRLQNVGDIEARTSSQLVDLAAALESLPAEISRGNGAAWEVLRQHLQRTGTGSADVVASAEEGDRQLDEPVAPTEPLPGNDEAGASSPPNTDAARAGASNGASVGPVDADMEDRPDVETARDTSQDAEPAQLQPTPQMLAEKREWLQELKEAVANLDLATMHSQLDRANASGMPDGNLVDGIMPSGDAVTVNVQVPPELNFKLRRLSVLQALSNADLTEAQRLTATLLGPLVDANSSLRPLLQQTMQWFLQTEQSAVQGVLQTEASAAAQFLNTHFSRLCGPTKRSAPDSIVDPPPPNSVQPRGDSAACAGASTSAGGGAANSSSVEAAASDGGPSTIGAAAAADARNEAADDTPAGAAAEDGNAAAAQSCRLVSLLQAGVFVYASWLCRVPPARRRAAATEPCGRVLGMHSLLNGGIDAAMAVLQALDAGEHGTTASGDAPSGAARATRLMPPDWAQRTSIAQERNPQQRRLRWFGPVPMRIRNRYLDPRRPPQGATDRAGDAFVPADADPDDAPLTRADARGLGAGRGRGGHRTLDTRLQRALMRYGRGHGPGPIGVSAMGAGGGGVPGSVSAFLAASESAALRERQLERASFRAHMLSRNYIRNELREMAAAVDREAGFRMQDYMDLHPQDPRSGANVTTGAVRGPPDARPVGRAAVGAAAQDLAAEDEAIPMDTDSDSHDADEPSQGGARAAAVRDPDGAEAAQPRGASGQLLQNGGTEAPGPAMVAFRFAPNPPPPPPPPEPPAPEAAAGADADPPDADADAPEAPAPDAEPDEDEEGEQMDLEEAVERLVEITNLPEQYARSVLIAHGGNLAASVAMVMDG